MKLARKTDFLQKMVASNLKEFINPKIHWCASLSDIKKASVWVSLESGGFSSLKYINDQNIKHFRAVLIEIENEKIQPQNVLNSLDELKKNNIPYFVLPKIREFLPDLANLIYPINQTKIPKLIAVTGTNGKTSISGFCNQIYQNIEQKNAFYSGTLGIGKMDGLKKSSLTTPDILHFSYHYYQFIKQQGEFGSIEASSHALAQKRLKNIAISSAIMSNISQDHFDYHHNFKQYFSAKKKLLKQKGLKNLIVNIDDSRLLALAKKVHQKNSLALMTISYKQIQPLFESISHLSASHIKLNSKGINFYLHYFFKNNQEETAKVHLPLYGRFNVENILLSIAGILSLENPVANFQSVVDCLKNIKPIDGRMHLVNQDYSNNDNLYFVDYAHTPDALEKTLQSLKIHFPERYLIAVFGAGGNRDQLKRPKMGSIVNSYCDAFFITSDNSRNESFDAIAGDIIKGIAHKDEKIPYKLIEKRKIAIDEAIELSYKNKPALVLVAGKGHEQTQVINNKVSFFSDTKTITKKLKQNAN